MIFRQSPLPTTAPDYMIASWKSAFSHAFRDVRPRKCRLVSTIYNTIMIIASEAGFVNDRPPKAAVSKRRNPRVKIGYFIQKNSLFFGKHAIPRSQLPVLSAFSPEITKNWKIHRQNPVFFVVLSAIISLFDKDACKEYFSSLFVCKLHKKAHKKPSVQQNEWLFQQISP